MSDHIHTALLGSMFRRQSFPAASSAAGFLHPFGASTPSAQASDAGGKSAKSTARFRLHGDAPRIDMWDINANAPLDYQGEFRPIRTSSPNIRISEHLPLIVGDAHRFSLIHEGAGTSVATIPLKKGDQSSPGCPFSQRPCHEGPLDSPDVKSANDIPHSNQPLPPCQIRTVCR